MKFGTDILHQNKKVVKGACFVNTGSMRATLSSGCAWISNCASNDQVWVNINTILIPRQTFGSVPKYTSLSNKPVMERECQLFIRLLVWYLLAHLSSTPVVVKQLHYIHMPQRTHSLTDPCSQWAHVNGCWTYRVHKCWNL
jgi:hypothetical protein